MKINNNLCFNFHETKKFALYLYMPILFLYTLAILYYYYALHITNNNSYSIGIIKFNNFFTNIFPGIKNKAKLGEILHNNGIYTEYILAVGFIIGILSSVFYLYFFRKILFSVSFTKQFPKIKCIFLFVLIVLLFIFCIYDVFFYHEISNTINDFSRSDKRYSSYIGVTIVNALFLTTNTIIGFIFFITFILISILKSFKI